MGQTLLIANHCFLDNDSNNCSITRLIISQNPAFSPSNSFDVCACLWMMQGRAGLTSGVRQEVAGHWIEAKVENHYGLFLIGLWFVIVASEKRN